jgi:phosphatidate cytidylyltransferase
MVMATGSPRSGAGGSPPGEPKRAPGRAGRDLPAAIGVGLGLGAVILVPLFTVRAIWIAVVSVAIAVGTYELVRALHGAGRVGVPFVPLALGAAASPIAAYLAGPTALVAVFAATIALTAAWWLGAGLTSGRFERGDLVAAVFCAAYIGVPSGFAALLTQPGDGPRRVVAFLATTVASDVGGYAAGVLSGGRHKMAPVVSPGKSWEGFAGSTITCVLVATIALTWPLSARPWQGALLGLAVVVTATVGDLGESLLKRDIGIKDMGNLLPGHGGIMDRLDSVLCTAPVAWLLITAFVPPG